MPQVTSCFSDKQLKWLLGITAFVAVPLNGLSTSGFVYADYFKFELFMSQKQVDFSMIMLYFGSILSFLSGVVFDKFGATAAVIIGSFLSISTSVSLSVAFAHPDFLRHHLWMLNSLLFLYSHGLIYSYVAVIGTCMSAFHKLGLLMSLLNMMCMLSAPLLALLNSTVFSDPNKSVQNPSTTMFALACYIALAHTMAFFFVRKNPSEVNEKTPILDKTDQTPSSVEDEVHSPDEAKLNQAETPADGTESDWSSLCSFRFLFLVLGSGLVLASPTVIIINVTSISRSLKLSEYNLPIIWVSMPFAAVAQIVTGVLIDRFTSSASQRAFALAAAAGITGCIGLGVMIVPVIGSGMATAVASFTLGTICLSIGLITLPPLLSVAESPSLYGRMFTACILMQNAAMLPLSLQFGAFYDSHSHRLTSNGTRTVCYGHECYASGAITLLAVHLLGVASIGAYGVSVRSRSK